MVTDQTGLYFGIKKINYNIICIRCQSRLAWSLSFKKSRFNFLSTYMILLLNITIDM